MNRGSGNDPSDAPRVLGGVVHTYLGYDPLEFPPPNSPRGGEAGDAMLEHMLMYGTRRKFTDRELANAIRLDPSQIRGLGPSLDAIKAMLEEKKRRILEQYETSRAQTLANAGYVDAVQRVEVPEAIAARLTPALQLGQLADIERIQRRVPASSYPTIRV